MGSGGKKGNGGVRRIVRKPFEVEGLANGPKVECEIDSLASPDDERVAPDVVILLHGQWSSGYDPLLLALSEAILLDKTSTKALDAVRVTFTTRFTEPFSGYLKERDEVLRVIAHLEERMKRKVVAIAGHSKGATVACLAASHYASNPNKFNGAVAAISGRHDLTQGVERSIGKKVVSSVIATREPQLVEIARRRPFWLTAERLEERASVNMDDVLQGMGESVPLLVIHGDRDERIPVGEAQAYADSHSKVAPVVAPEVHIMEGADHCFMRPPDRQRMANLCSRFVHKLGDDARFVKKA